MEIHEILVEKGELYLLSLLFTVRWKHGQEPEKKTVELSEDISCFQCYSCCVL